jgi:tetratricopeptide (TPR) repeat protein
MIDKHNALLQRAHNLIAPSMLLDGNEEREVQKTHVCEGIKCLDELLNLNPKNWVAYWMKSKAYQALDEHENAYNAAKEGLDIQCNADLLREYVRECLYLEKIKEAVFYAGEAMDLNADPGLEANFALVLMFDNQLERALRVAKSALEKDPADVKTQEVVTYIEAVVKGEKELPKSLGELERADG